MPIRALSLAALAAVMPCRPGGTRQAPARRATQIGTLACDVSGGVGMIVTSKKAMVCTFTNVARRVARSMRARSASSASTSARRPAARCVWTVFAPTVAPCAARSRANMPAPRPRRPSSAGSARTCCVGGSNRSIALQPVSVGGQAGLNLAVGVADLQLRSVRA